MNLLRECTFFDRHRNSKIELDDLVEESSQHLLTSTPTSTSSSFYLILYFSADWLPDVSNTQLNEKLQKFMDTMKSQNLESPADRRRPLELVFVSSDKTSDSYWNFLDKFKFIRYSLAFHEKELKVDFNSIYHIYLFYISFC